MVRTAQAVVALVLAGAVGVAGPAAGAQPQPPDFGATILVNQGLRLVARQGVDNDATVSALGDDFLELTDETGLNIGWASCWYPIAGDNTVVLCPNLGSPLEILLTDGDDRLLLVGEHFVPGHPASEGWEVDLGDGDDVLDAARTATVGDYVGGAGDDRFVSGVEEDDWHGGSGVDTVDYGHAQRASSHGVTVQLEVDGAGSGGRPLVHVEGTPAAWEDALWSTENAVGTRFDDELGGSDAKNDLDGGRGDDELSGGGADDVLVGGADDDTLVGGAGIDRASYRDRTTAVTVDRHDLGGHGGPGESDVYGGDVEGVIGTNAGDTLIGTGGTDHFLGDACLTAANPCPIWRGAGADTITTGGGMDDVHGGFGPDTIDGGAGSDGLNGGDGDDRILGGPDYDLIIGGNGTDDCDIGPDGGMTSTCE